MGSPGRRGTPRRPAREHRYALRRRFILRDLETRARERGATRVRLETGDRQPEAVRLYEGAGYRQIPNFGDYVDAQASLCFERILEAID
jgi:hypothetical protein